MPANDEYLSVAAERLVTGYGQVLAATEPKIEKVYSYIDEAWVPPFVGLYLAQTQDTPISFQSDAQIFTIGAQLVVGLATDAYDGYLVSRLWVIIPTVLNFFKQHRNLAFEAAQRAPQWMQPSKTEWALARGFGLLPPKGRFIGVEFQHRLVFHVRNEQEDI